MTHTQIPSFDLYTNSSQFGSALITIPVEYVKKLYDLASSEQQAHVHTFGFSKGKTPLSYIEKNFQPHLIDHVKEFLFKYFVVDWLYKELYAKKILLASEPTLQDISVSLTSDARFSFSLNLAQPINLQGWKRHLFKCPKRKNYKDLDRQVELFLKEETLAQKKEKDATVKEGDWINFDLQVLQKNKPLFNNYTENVWLKIGNEEGDNAYRSLFLNKQVGDIFTSNHDCLQAYFSSHLDTHYHFKITILDRLSHGFFCTEHFKKHFKLRTAKEMHQKLIEIFSYRNDISQRRAIVEEVLKLLLSKHGFHIPQHLVLNHQKNLLRSVQESPDYQVYKIQHDFQEKIHTLAEKQVKEHIFIHQLALYEGITIDNNDIKNYLNLTTRQRTYEFIYFELPNTKYLGHEIPLSRPLLIQSCIKEKTLNHAIYHLTRGKSTL